MSGPATSGVGTRWRRGATTVAEARAHLTIVERAYSAALAAQPKRWTPSDTEGRERIRFLTKELKKARETLFVAEIAEAVAKAGPAKTAKKARGRVVCLRRPRLRGCVRR